MPTLLHRGQSPPPALIPDENSVRMRLTAVCREARLLRRQLVLSRQAAEIIPEEVTAGNATTPSQSGVS